MFVMGGHKTNVRDAEARRGASSADGQPLCGSGVTSSMLLTARPAILQSRDRTLATAAGALHSHVDFLDAVLGGLFGGLLGGALPGERRALTDFP
jgi:hypothetical protein